MKKTFYEIFLIYYLRFPLVTVTHPSSSSLTLGVGSDVEVEVEVVEEEEDDDDEDVDEEVSFPFDEAGLDCDLGAGAFAGSRWANSWMMPLAMTVSPPAV